MADGVGLRQGPGIKPRRISGTERSAYKVIAHAAVPQNNTGVLRQKRTITYERAIRNWFPTASKSTFIYHRKLPVTLRANLPSPHLTCRPRT
jgi:hypothetical protein